MTPSTEQSQALNDSSSNESPSSGSHPGAEVVLDGQEADNNREAPSLANSGPQLDAIRGNDIPTIFKNGLQAPKEPRRRRRRGSDAPTEASRMTVWDRGESLYAEAFPPGARRPEVARPTKPATAPLLDRVDSLRLRSSQPNGAGFYPRGSVEALITEEEVARVIERGRLFLESAGRPPLAEKEIQRYARRVCDAQLPPDGTGTDRGFKKMFAILLLLDRGWEIVLFVDADINDSQLPLKAVYVNGYNSTPRMRLASDPDVPLACLSGWSAMMHELFEQTQYSMLAPFFARGARRQAKFYQLSEKVVLPWIKEERSNREGGYGWISKVEIHSSHHNFERSDSDDELRDEAERPPRPANNLFAVKHFKPNLHARVDRRSHSQNSGSGHMQTANGASKGWNLGDADALTPETLQAIRRDFEREIEILNRFSGDTHEHLISLQAAFRHGDEYCVIIPWAEGDLKHMWMRQSHGDPLDKANLEWLLKQCRGIASGLQKIHFYQTSETLPPSSGDTDDDSDDSNDATSSRRVYGRHGDIKPENILLFRNPHDPRDRGRLVITDFGLTRFHTDGTRTYFTSKDVVATMTYRPPECDMEGCTISRSFDIWSLGCVLLEFVAWYLGGWKLVHSFVQHRKVYNPLVFGFRIDQFFEIVRGGAPDGLFYSRVKHEVHDVSFRARLSGFTPE